MALNQFMDPFQGDPTEMGVDTADENVSSTAVAVLDTIGRLLRAPDQDSRVRIIQTLPPEMEAQFQEFLAKFGGYQ